MNTKQVVVYVAGPFRGTSHWQQEQNVRNAEAMALEVWKLGHVALCPHTNTRFFQGELPDDAWLIGDIELLKRCDVLLVCEGWRDSKGTLAEIACAQLNDLTVLYSLNEFKAFLESR